MQKFFTLILAICLCFTSAFAAGKGASVSASNALSGKLLKAIIETRYGAVTTLEYNSQSQLISASSVDGDWSEITTFDYTGGTINGTAYDVKILIKDSEETNSLYITVGDNLFATSVYQEIESKYDGNSTSTWAFEYNADGQLVKMTRDEGETEVTTLTYTDGDITGVTVDCGSDGIETKTIRYDNALENKSGIMLYDMGLGIDMDEMQIAYFAGLLGKPTKHLPTACVGGDDYAENYTWIVGEDGYPTIFIVEFEGSYDNYAFAWEDNSGVQGVSADTAVRPVEYYNLQGVRVANPAGGLYIVRNSNGTTSKVLLK